MIRVALLLLLALAGPFCAVAHASTLVPASALEDAPAEETAADPTVLVEVTEDGMGTGQVVGIVIGSLLALIIVIVVVVSVIRRMGRYSP
ncbi:hypothetical protein ANANG_G00226010 [Anguilla anguilla]|uniref:Uncharacterized protein n=1 Tax=Anguilla anguilla TaxID=7936 RepID=A0A9D3RPT5_ANGAN|nr:hypothetical protein ANANG_G00226010 [Anguilla anguilla]